MLPAPNMNDTSPISDIDDEEDGPRASMVEIFTWVGESKGLIALISMLAAVVAVGIALILPQSFTARTTLLPPGAQQQSGSAAALASLGALTGLAGGIGGKTPDELYVALLRSDTVLRALDERLKL